MTSLLTVTAAGSAGSVSHGGGVVIDAEFPGGNITVESMDGNRVVLRQDLRDTEGWWFYWSFRVRGAAGLSLDFHFSDGDVIGTRGPAISKDGGLSWAWLGERARSDFTYAFPDGADDVRFAFVFPYMESDLQRFLAPFSGSPNVRSAELCRTPKGRSVERLHVGRLDGRCRYRVLLTARHHACESVADYELEGILATVLSDTADGAWFRENVEIMAIPFVDKDGVEDGDQGKNRRPRDHNRDYADTSLYASVGTLRQLVPEWADGKLALALDLHCPHIRGYYNEHVYFVGQDNPGQWELVGRFSGILESVLSGPVPFDPLRNLGFGQAWNTGKSFSAGLSFARWAHEIPGIRLAGTIEFPYANVMDWTVTADGVRAFGGDLARAIRRYLE